MLPTKFRVSWPFGSGEEEKNRFSRWLLWWPSSISDQKDFTIFDLLVTPILPTTFQDEWPFCAGEETKINFEDSGHDGYLGYRIV